MNTNNNKFLAFSLTGDSIPPQPTASPLVDLTLSSTESGADVCLEGVVRLGEETRFERKDADDGERGVRVVGDGLRQVTSDPSALAVSSQSPVCAVVVDSPPPALSPPPVAVADVTIDVPLVDDNLQSAISIQTNVPISGFQFDVVDNNLNAASIDSE